MDELNKEESRARRSNSNFGIILFDLDLFKEVNDTYGHEKGNLLLKAVSDILKENARRMDTVARYGGEEFAVILPETPPEKAHLAAERLRSRIETRVFVTPDVSHPISITVSIGLAAYPEDATTKRDKKDDYDKAIKDFNKALEIDPLFADAYIQRGLVYGLKNNYKQSIKDYTEAIEINPGFAEAYYNRRLAYDYLGEKAKSLADSTRAGALDSRYATTSYEYGAEESAKDKKIKEVNISQEAKEYLKKGLLWDKQGKYDLAIEDYDRALKISPNFASAYFYKGLAKYNKGEIQKAFEDFKRALDLDPGNNEYRRIVSSVGEKLKKSEGSKEDKAYN